MIFFYCGEDEEITEKSILVCNRCTVGHKANLKNDSAVEYAVSNIDRTADVSTVYEFDGKIKPYKDRLKYKNGYARKGKKYRLRIKSLNHNLQISGRWNS